MTVAIDAGTTVRELVGRYPQTRHVFEEHGIDYCCGGGRSLREVAEKSGAELPTLVADLETSLAARGGSLETSMPDWYATSLGELVDHILQVHHTYTKDSLPRIRALVSKVRAAHGTQHGEMLRQVQGLFEALDAELSEHLMKEEQTLFPYIVATEAHARGQSTSLPLTCFGTVRSPIHQMEHEHDSAGRTLEMLRQVTGNYRLPDDACPTFAAMYDELQQLEADLHQHIHLENNILFPRAMELEG
ncbi:MAG: iron-sulfur cluster repair di-iron protein [Thermoguttaceae bacterium]|jgi:regulator of cell morphogenesis and NO signaling